MMKRMRLSLGRFALALWLLTMAQAQDFVAVRQGVEHLRMTRGIKSQDEATGPFVINLLRIDLNAVDIRIAHAMDSAVGLETVTSMANRYGAVAAINAGFFATTGTYRGDNVSVLKIDGKLLSEPARNRAAVGFIKQAHKIETLFGHLKFDGRLETAGGLRRKVEGMNRPRAENELIIFTPEFHRTTLTMPSGIEVVVRRGRVSQIKDHSGSTRIPEDGFVISASGEARLWALKHLRNGSRLKLTTRLIALEGDVQDKWNRAANIISGTPQLIRDGRIEITRELEGAGINFVKDRHPRTAIAKLKDGRILLVVVDGRQQGYSTGMSLTSLAELLLEFGAVEATNLDGGGSSAMVVEGKLVNKPSDAAGERAVSDALLIVNRGKIDVRY
jgi:exopolysaccharide biosynthesis protein